jgi:hypothetical protein
MATTIASPARAAQATIAPHPPAAIETAARQRPSPLEVLEDTRGDTAPHPASRVPACGGTSANDVVRAGRGDAKAAFTRNLTAEAPLALVRHAGRVAQRTDGGPSPRPQPGASCGSS